MKTKHIPFLILLTVFATGCSSNKPSNDGLACIDVRKNYPVKEIVLTDIANVSYVHLNTENTDYLYRFGFIISITENTLEFIDPSSGNLLFFSRDGNPKSRFNRYGNGPQEYPSPYFNSFYDETADDVFVHVFDMLKVYSSAGNYKRTLTLPTRDAQVLDYDDQSIFVCDDQRQQKNMSLFFRGIDPELPPHPYDSSYFRISKIDGTILEYVVRTSNNNDTGFAVRKNRSNGTENLNYSHFRKCAAGLLLCNPAIDTVFLYNTDKSITPLICKNPLVNKLNPKILLTYFMDAGKYQYMRLSTVALDEHDNYLPVKYLMRDKETGNIYCQRIILPDYKGYELCISAHNTLYNGKETITHFSLDLLKLKQAYQENKLSGKLKELVATLDENKDNEVYVMAVHK